MLEKQISELNESVLALNATMSEFLKHADRVNADLGVTDESAGEPFGIADMPDASVKEPEKGMDSTYTLDDVRQALLELKRATDADTAKELIEEFTDGKRKVDLIKEKDYAAVIEQCGERAI